MNASNPPATQTPAMKKELYFRAGPQNTPRAPLLAPVLCEKDSCRVTSGSKLDYE